MCVSENGLVWAQYQWRPDWGVGFLGATVTGHFESPDKGSGDLLILVPSKEQQAFLTTEFQCHPYVFETRKPTGPGVC